MDAVTYSNWQKTFAVKAAAMSDEALIWSLKDINVALSIAGELGGYVNPVSGMTDYQQKLWLEKDEFIAELGRRPAKTFKREYGA